MSISLRNPLISSIKTINLIHHFFCYENLIYLNKDEVVIDIPKSGSSFIKSNLIFNKKDIFSINKNYPHTALFKRPVKIFNKIDDLKTIYIFIKDPLERFCSVYREKIINHNFLKNNWNPNSFSLSIKNSRVRNIDELVYFLTNSKPNQVDKHLRPQFDFAKKYINKNNVKILSTTNLTNTIKELFGDKIYHGASLKSNKRLFNISNISNKNIRLLKEFYKEDLNLIREFKIQ